MSLESESSGWQPQPYGDEGDPPQAGPTFTNGFAVAALVLGIIGITTFPIIPSILAIVFGYKARSEIDRSGGRQHGRGMATAGLVLGWIAIILAIVIVAVAALVIIPAGFATFGASALTLGR